MTMTDLFAYVAIGANATAAQQRSAGTLRTHHRPVDYLVITRDCTEVHRVDASNSEEIQMKSGRVGKPLAELKAIPHSRYLKVSQIFERAKAAGADYCIYIDADTRFNNDPQVLLDILHDGFDLVIAPSGNQTHDHLWHCDEDDRMLTYIYCGHVPLALQGGMFGFAINERTAQFFDRWLKEWALFHNQDQAALLRALYDTPLKVHLVGHPLSWSGALIAHQFGTARE